METEPENIFERVLDFIEEKYDLIHNRLNPKIWIPIVIAVAILCAGSVYLIISNKSKSQNVAADKTTQVNKTTQKLSQPLSKTGICGDGTCDDVERNTGKCPSDCNTNNSPIDNATTTIKKADTIDTTPTPETSQTIVDKIKNLVGIETCGNGTCASTETASSCPSDCRCSSWTYSDWGDCQSDGKKNRNVTSSSPSGCTGGSPDISKDCTYKSTTETTTSTCTSWTYSDWGTCQSNNTQTRTVSTSSPSGCADGSPILSQACTYVAPVIPTCTSWTYSDWGTCQSNNTQTRTVATSSPSGCTGGSPVLSQACNPDSSSNDTSSIGVIGCSLTLGAVKGYETLGGNWLWSPKELSSYPGGNLPIWYSDISKSSSDASNRWTTFTDLSAKYNPGKIWWMLCNSDKSSEITYDKALAVYNKIKEIAPKAEIYISYAPKREGYTCSLEDPNGEAQIESIAKELINEGKAKAGVNLTALTQEETADGCHPTSAGEEIWGNDLLSFFANSSGNVSSKNPLDFAAAVHLEGQWVINDKQTYLNTTARINDIIDLFSKYNAKITIESEMPYVDAIGKYGANNDDSLHYALNKGHGVGTHCDFNITTSFDQELANYKSRKAKVDAIVGAENNRGCSGGLESADWAKAAYQAGFSYLHATVMLGYLAVPVENRPINPDTGTQYTDAEIRTTYYHDPILPVEDSMYLRRLKDTNDLKDDGTGIVVFTGSIGEVPSLYEDRKSCWPKCTLTSDDTDYIMNKIDYVNSIKDESKVSMISIHFPDYTLIQQSDSKGIIETWLQEMQKYQNEGKIKWRTMGEVYDDYVASESGNSNNSDSDNNNNSDNKLSYLTIDNSSKLLYLSDSSFEKIGVINANNLQEEDPLVIDDKSRESISSDSNPYAVTLAVDESKSVALAFSKGLNSSFIFDLKTKKAICSVKKDGEDMDWMDSKDGYIVRMTSDKDYYLYDYSCNLVKTLEKNGSISSLVSQDGEMGILDMKTYNTDIVDLSTGQVIESTNLKAEGSLSHRLRVNKDWLVAYYENGKKTEIVIYDRNKKAASTMELDYTTHVVGNMVYLVGNTFFVTVLKDDTKDNATLLEIDLQNKSVTKEVSTWSDGTPFTVDSEMKNIYYLNKDKQAISAIAETTSQSTNLIAGAFSWIADSTTGIVSKFVNRAVEFIGRKCGDGICGPAEKTDATLCPTDCTSSDTATTTSKSTSATSTSISTGATQGKLNRFLNRAVEFVGRKCGDGFCGPAEKADATLCPKDCNANTAQSSNNSSVSNQSNTNATTQDKCGDGFCGPLEKEQGSCPQDCVSTTTTTKTTKTTTKQNPCGDGTCSAAEKADPALCPQDCK